MTRRRFAEDTKVPVDRTRQDLERLLRGAGAEGYATAWDPTQDLVEFLWKGKQIRFVLPRLATSSTGRRDQEERRRWRALLLVVKAKLEAVQSGISVFEQEFLGYIVVPATGRTIYEHAQGPLAAKEWDASRLFPTPPGAPKED